MLTQSNEAEFPLIFDTSCFTWINWSQDEGIRMAFFFVHYKNTLEGWAFNFHTIGSDKNFEFKLMIFYMLNYNNEIDA